MRHTRGYIHKFDTKAQFDTARANDYVEPWLSYTESEAKVDYNKGLLETPLTFEITGGGNIVWKAYNTAYTVTLEYKKNDGEWTSITSTTGGTTIPVVSGDTVQFRGNNATMTSGSSRYNCFSGTSCQFNVKGNIMSLVDNTGYISTTTLESAYIFNRLFTYCTGLTDASKLLLPATTLKDYCYYYMFSNCTNLLKAPSIPATTLAQRCYSNMFRSCTSLTTAPALPVTTLASGCYYNMFYGCTSLTTASELPATTLASECYYNMFYGCTSLTTAPQLPATTLATYCYDYMFKGCTNLTTAPELPATTLASNCYSYMFQNCTSLTTAPELPAITLANSCYRSMFNGCTNLTTAPELPATTLANQCYENMFSGCTSLNYIRCFATDISATYCTSGWVSGVSSTGTFVKNSLMASWSTGTNGIPSNWTVQDAS